MGAKARLAEPGRNGSGQEPRRFSDVVDVIVIGINRGAWVRVETMRGKRALRVRHVDGGQESACSGEKGECHEFRDFLSRISPLREEITNRSLQPKND